MSVIISEKQNTRGTSYQKDENVLMTVKRALNLNPEEIITLEAVPAVVLDVIRDASHPQLQPTDKNLLHKYQTPANFDDVPHLDTDKDFTWIGRALVRILSKEQGVDGSTQTWAYPLENGIKEYPLINEVVVLTKHLDSFYYSRKLNAKNLVNHNAQYSAERAYGNNFLKDNPNVEEPDAASIGSFCLTPPSDETGPICSFFSGYLGKYFTENHKIRPLQHYEGDTIIEGRTGNSIRFGCFVNNSALDIGDGLEQSYPSKTGNPMILIRNRQKPNISETTFAQPMLEDINLDGSSIQITSGLTKSQYKTTVQKFMYGQEEQPDFSGDGPPLPALTGNQIVVNTDRLVFSSRANETFFFSKQRYSIITDDIYTVDANQKIAITTNSSYHLKAHDRIDVKTHQTTTWESVKDITHFTQETTSWNSKKSILFQTPEEFTINANKKMNIVSPEIYLGKSNETNEPVLMGSTTMTWIANVVYELIWRLGYKVDKPGPKPALTEEYIHYKFMDKIMEDLMRQAPNCISRKVFVAGHDEAPGIGKMKRKPHNSPFSKMKR